MFFRKRENFEFIVGVSAFLPVCCTLMASECFLLFTPVERVREKVNEK